MLCDILLVGPRLLVGRKVNLCADDRSRSGLAGNSGLHTIGFSLYPKLFKGFLR